MTISFLQYIYTYKLRGGTGISKVARPLQINVHGGSTTGNVQRSKPTWLKRPVHNFVLFKQPFLKHGLVGSLRNRAIRVGLD